MTLQTIFRGSALLFLLACLGMISPPEAITPRPGETQLKCQRPAKPIIIDGRTTDWGENLTYELERGAVAGAMNDDKYLYVCIQFTGQGQVERIIGSGLTLWINQQGKKKKLFGIHYPIGVAGYADELQKNLEANSKQTGKPDPDALEAVKAKRARTLRDESREYEIKLPDVKDEELQGYATNRPGGLKAALKDSAEVLIYEVAIPLQSTEMGFQPISLKPGSALMIGLESGILKFKNKNANNDLSQYSAANGGSSYGGGGYGRGGYGAGGYGRGGYGGGYRQPSQPSSYSVPPLKAWIPVLLAQ